ncbi:hypothetical protein MGG_18053 [Pyricularia oryzae 70-15]|uniref:Uncharacterized protein n=3 Tax=Pyricularia oryzae TaxID=318829 RepID=G5EI01_PYRO7|nr:uncharacterized protein MGG_18053 [Pyricularia oryzae 70-15]EAQ70726.1 hypothetical protein MGCH7_ch7g133 [Pyricularia oryzae 70-15]EHA46624.1 hypothetical protein MGG_18053 [Pyricularia oryzae 70-15]ELQ40854.1 hypothetical protein OOU_Y34scaffold00334g24 [Pyricularia oryzae Y34]
MFYDHTIVRSRKSNFSLVQAIKCQLVRFSSGGILVDWYTYGTYLVPSCWIVIRILGSRKEKNDAQP